MIKFSKEKGNNTKINSSPFEEAYQATSSKNSKHAAMAKTKAEHVSISERYLKERLKENYSKSTDLGSFGESKFNLSLKQKPAQEKSRMKKQSVVDDDELLFAVAQDSPK